MNTNSKSFAVLWKMLFLTAAILTLTAQNSSAQDSILALGRVAANGTLSASANTIDGLVSTSRDGEGNYTIIVTGIGAFTGTSGSDYAVETTINSSASNDEAIRSAITSVFDNQLTIKVRTDDVEDVANSAGNVQFPNDASFFFTLYQIPDSPLVSAESRFLAATGRVDSSGDLISFAGIEGMTVTAQRFGEGDYCVDLEKDGAFTTDSAYDYVFIASSIAPNTNDITVRAAVFSTMSDNQALFIFRTDDVQQSTDHDQPTAMNSRFAFSIYRLTGFPESEPSPSSLLVGLANISALGSINASACSIPGATVSATRNSNGRYTVTIFAPGAFTGKTEADYLAHANIVMSISGDESANIRPEIVDANTLEIDVSIYDVEEPGSNFGTPTNRGFHLTILEANSNFQPDLRIGKGKNHSSMKGNNRYNGSGGGQQARIRLPQLKTKKFHFALENDGNLTEQYRLRESGSGNKLKVKFYRLTGGRKNVTAQITRTGLLENGLSPGSMIKYQGLVKYRKINRRPTRKVKVKASSLSQASSRDTNRVKIKAR